MNDKTIIEFGFRIIVRIMEISGAPNEDVVQNHLT